ncbi:MAG: TetR/AcrR family transcriptional regulator, partial [Desulfosalsimonas sp.]
MQDLQNVSEIEEFDDFRKMALLSMEEICRDIFRENQHRIKIKKESVAVRNLVNIFNTTLEISNEKGFQNMSLRDLSRISGLSMGALYSYFSSKEELLEMIQNQGRRITLTVLSRRVNKEDSPSIQLRAAMRTHLY